MQAGSSRCSTPRWLRGPNRAARSLRFTTLDLHVRFVAVEQVEYKPKCESRALLTIPG
jgi:hypothetical protein